MTADHDVVRGEACPRPSFSSHVIGSALVDDLADVDDRAQI